MSQQFKKYKRIFRHNLQPIFALLVARRNTMPALAWDALVDDTVAHILSNPVEYLGPDLPHSSLIRDIIDEIRLDFFKELATYRPSRA